jgi:hypothetical protein
MDLCMSSLPPAPSQEDPLYQEELTPKAGIVRQSVQEDRSSSQSSSNEINIKKDKGEHDSR